MEKYYVDYKCYLGDKRRCAVFGRVVNNKIEIFILKCAKNDFFRKEFARDEYERFRNGFANIFSHPEVIYTPIVGGHSIQWQFSQFCIKNFYKRDTAIIRMRQDKLYKKGEPDVYIGTSRKVASKLDLI